MGWCSGTEIFDVVCKEVLDAKEIDKKQFIKTLIKALEEKDWDC